ncbi:ImcF-related family protein, partial [Pseudomonas sp.]|uniref:ImcF-related family protein n=1 Tax=Pseudomonas sp. TaxID=306 RepID=UPI003D6F4B1C
MTREVESQKLSSWHTALVLALVLAVLVFLGGAVWWFLLDTHSTSLAALHDLLLKGLLCWALLFGAALLVWLSVNKGIRGLVGGGQSLPSSPQPEEDSEQVWLAPLRKHLREHYGLLWRRKVRLLLVVGEPEQVDAIAPGLTERHWLEGGQTVLVWGGSLADTAQPSLLNAWRGLTRWRALDGVVWALTQAQSADAKTMSHALSQLRNTARELRWHLPVHLWQVCASAWPQDDRPTQSVGCLLPAGISAEQLDARLTALLPPLCQTGLAQIQKKRGHDFLLRLGRDLHAEGIARWRQALSPVFNKPARGLALRGLWFSLPLSRSAQAGNDNHWPADPAWLGVLGDQTGEPRRLGWPASRIAYAAVLCLATVWGAGMLLSFATNRVQLAQVQNALTTLQQAAPGAEQRRALHQLVDDLARLEYRMAHGAPWYQRFGLNQSQALHDALWPHYVQANQQLLRDPAAATLQRQLNALVQLPADSPERATRATEAYTQLKAYLMLARPEKANPAFLLQTLGSAEPELWQFYAEHLAANPQWRLDADPALVAQARQVLLGQLGQRNAQASLYQQVLDTAVNHYPALGLQQLVG